MSVKYYYRCPYVQNTLLRVHILCDFPIFSFTTGYPCLYDARVLCQPNNESPSLLSTLWLPSTLTFVIHSLLPSFLNPSLYHQCFFTSAYLFVSLWIFIKTLSGLPSVHNCPKHLHNYFVSFLVILYEVNNRYLRFFHLFVLKFLSSLSTNFIFSHGSKLWSNRLRRTFFRQCLWQPLPFLSIKFVHK